jgi:ribose transport system substrate-binding protein
VAFVTNNAAPFWVIARAGCDQAVQELGDVEVDFRIPSSGATSEQRQILDDLVTRGIDGIAVSPIDPANQTEFLNTIASQTLLICHDSDAPASDRVCYIGTDNVAAGREAGKLIKEALPEGGRIMLFVGTVDAQNAKDRMAGIYAELEGSNVEVIDVRTDDTDRVRAQKNVEDTLVKYPDVSCLVGLWSYNGPAILNATQSAGKIGQVKIVVFDEEDATLSGVASGAIYGTVVQQPYEFGRQAITRMRAHLRCDTEALAGGMQFVPTLNVTKDNVAEFQARLAELLGK